MTEAEFLKACDDVFAPAMVDIPGMISKVWLKNSETNTYGGVYTWRDRQAMEEYMNSEFFKGVASHPNFANITSSDFSVIEGPTRVTRGLVEVRA
jgi:hypothetical protein